MMAQQVDRLAGGGTSAQAVAAAIAYAFTSGGNNAQALAKATAVAIAKYNCSTIAPTLAREC